MAQSDLASTDPLSIHGVVPPTVTAFHDDESVDYESTAAHARYVVDGGAHGVFSLGTNGEFASLGPEERAGVTEAVVEEVDGDVPVIAGVGAPSTYQSVANATRAESAGADGIVLVTPYYFPADHRGVVEHYRRVAAAVSTPIYVYHIPSRTGNSLSLDAVAEIADIDGVAGLKDSSKDVPWLGQAIAENPSLTYLSGSDSLLVPGLDLGCSGMVSAVANAFPELVVELYEAYAGGDRERARELQATIYEVRGALKTGGGYMSGVKTALRLRGFDAGPLRSPLRLKDEASEAEMAERLEALGVL